MPVSDGLTWGTTSATVNVGETITVNVLYGLAPTSAGITSRLNNLATAVLSGNTVTFTGVSTGTVTIPSGTNVGDACLTTNDFTLTVTLAEDESYLNKRGLAHFWENVDDLKQNKLTAGAGILITNDVISATGGGTADAVDWGHITGSMSNQTDLTTALAAKANSADLATVATSGDYDDLTNKPTIGNATLTIQKNGTTVNTFTANASSNVTANITVPTKTSDLTNDGSDNTSTYLEADETAYRTTSIPYGQCDNTSTATVFTATVPGITELRDGVCMWLKNGVVTSASGFTININNLGAKPVYNNMAAATRDTTLWNVNYTMFFVYDSTRVEGGCWILYRGYNSDNNTIGYQVRTNSQSLPMSSVVYRYRLLFTSADGTHYVPANNSTSTDATTNRAVCQEKINPFGRIFYYSATASVAAESRPSATALWEQYALALGYSFAKGAALTMTPWKPVYLKCTPQTDGSAIIDSATPWVQDLPTTEDGEIYIFLGIAYSATNIELQLDHPIYYYKDGVIKPWTNSVQGMLPGVESELPVNGSEEDFYLIPSSNPGSKKESLLTDDGFLAIGGAPAGGQLNLIELQGNATQQTYTGKNLVNINTQTNSNTTTTVSGQSITVTTNNSSATARSMLPVAYTPNQQLTLSFDATCLTYEPTATNTVLVYMRYNSTFAQQVTLNKTIGTTTHYSVTFTPTVADMTLWLYLKSSPVAGVVSYRFDNIQIEYGASETSYEPFVGAIPSPSPDYPQVVETVTGAQTINITNKNLLSLDEVTLSNNANVTVTHNTNDLTIKAVTTTGAQYASATLENMNPSTTYRISGVGKKILKGTDGRPWIYVRWRGSNDGSTWGNWNDIYSRQNPVQGTEYPFSGSFSGFPFYQILFYNNANTPVTVGETTEYSQLQIEIGGQSTEFEPHQGQKYEVNLGKNLMPMAVSDNTTARQNTFNINLPAGTYTVSFDLSDITMGSNSSFTPYMKLAKSDNGNAKDFALMTINSSTTPGRYTVTIDLTTEASSIGVSDVRIPQTQWNNGARCKLSNIQIEAGSVGTSYAPYSANPIELAKIGNYQDYIWNDGDDWKIHKAIGKVVLNGSETWGQTTSPARYYYTAISDALIITDTSANSPVISDYYSPATPANIYNGAVDYGISLNTGTARFRVRNKDCADSTVFTTWLASNPTTVYYALATPTDETITDEELIDQLNSLYPAQLVSGPNSVMLLPATGALQGELALTAVIDDPENRYDEYVWVDSLSGYEKVGVNVDGELLLGSANPVQNGVVSAAISNIESTLKTISTKVLAVAYPPDTGDGPWQDSFGSLERLEYDSATPPNYIVFGGFDLTGNDLNNLSFNSEDSQSYGIEEIFNLLESGEKIILNNVPFFTQYFSDHILHDDIKSDNVAITDKAIEENNNVINTTYSGRSAVIANIQEGSFWSDRIINTVVSIRQTIQKSSGDISYCFIAGGLRIEDRRS